MPRSEPMGEIAETMKRAAATLREREIPFVLAGSLASWARGGPETHHDLDFVLRPEDAERALEALDDAGMRTEKPPEEWLYKAWDGNVLVDLIFGPSGLEADAAIERSEVLSVLSMELPVMALEDVLVTKLLALTEHELDYRGALETARALREQVDWEDVRRRTAESPFAEAYFLLLDRLGIVPLPEEPGDGEPRVRVDVTTR